LTGFTPFKLHGNNAILLSKAGLKSGNYWTFITTVICRIFGQNRAEVVTKCFRLKTYCTPESKYEDVKCIKASNSALTQRGTHSKT